MAYSMTGYGRYETIWQDTKLSIEIKSVNHRFSEVVVRSPRHLMLFEESIKRHVLEHVFRGRIEVYITCNTDAFIKKKIQVDWELASALVAAAKQLQEKLKIQGQVTIQDLVVREELFQMEEEVSEIDDAFGSVLLDAVKQAILQLLSMREQEGARLVQDLRLKLETIKKYTDEIRILAPQVKESFAQRLETKLRELLEHRAEIEESRLLTEVGIFAEKTDIDEELTRLASHCEQFKNILQSNEPIGRKLDFLVQEMNREVNTIGSKANDISISQIVVELKSQLEKMREQVQNIE